jgi:ParB family transcriptional regulator, chromosome partitioning protein
MTSNTLSPFLMQQALWSEPHPSAVESSDEAYTPPWLADAARSVLGAIDLDPASCTRAQTVIQAATWYSQAQDGLAQSWRGRVWCNPPYSNPLPWVQKALQHYSAGDVPAALLLLRGDTSTEYSHLLGRAAEALCMLRRIDFWPRRRNAKTGKLSSPDFPVLLWYLGPDVEAFRAVFDYYGPIR